MKKSAFFLCVVISLSSVCNIFSDIVSAQTIPSFSRTDYPVSSILTTTELVDFNNDDILDIAIATNDKISIMLGNNDGSFSQHVNINVQNSSRDILTDDFNNDGNIDLLLNTSFLFGNGTGSFLKGDDHLLNGYYLNSGDFNNDDITDIIILSDDSTFLNVHTGNGNGTFNSPISNNTLTGRNLYPKATGDFNSDGNLDVVVFFECITDEYGSACKCLRTEAPVSYNNVAVLFGNGDGTFQDSTHVIKEEYSGLPIHPFFLIADINNDNNQDIFYYGSRDIKNVSW